LAAPRDSADDEDDNDDDMGVLLLVLRESDIDINIDRVQQMIIK
jgi:hypothetical protein